MLLGESVGVLGVACGMVNPKANGSFNSLPWHMGGGVKEPST
jgi:hypothetical protein